MRHLALYCVIASVATSGCDPSFFNRDSGASDAGLPGDAGGVDAAGDGGPGDGGPGDGGGDAGVPVVELDAIEPLFVGAWREVKVRVHGIPFDDVTFQVAGGPDGGFVSASRGEDFDPANPQVMLLAGWKPGTYALQAIHLGAVVAEVPFDVTLDWLDEDFGPPRWFDGPTGTQPPGPRASDAWGGGGMGVQNFNVNPQSGNRHVLIVFVDFTDAQYPADAAIMDGFKANWLDHLVNGVNRGGEVRSVAAFWNEVSGGQLTVTAEAAGPVRLDRTFAQTFEDGWAWSDRLQRLINTIQDTLPALDLTTFDVILFVTPTWNIPAADPCVMSNGGTEICDGLDNDCDGLIDALDPGVAAPCITPAQCGDGIVSTGEACDDGNTAVYDRCSKDCQTVQTRHFAWPSAIGAWGPFTFRGNISRSPAFTSMPNDWTALDGREVYATYAHEFGHNLGLGDEYTPDVPGRNTGAWEMMHAETFLPHITLSQRLLLGWVDPADLLAFQPSPMASDTVDLTPVGRLSPAPGEKIGVEVRVTSGWNYYFEYRLRQAGHIGDHGAPIPQAAPGLVLGTDRISDPAGSPIARPPLLLVPIQAGSDGPALAAGDRFEQRDPPANELRLTVNSADADRANVSVEYGTFRPDPALRPWNPPPWQSPSIEVRNARSLADPEWLNTPWVGKLNTLVAKVENPGTGDAPGVTVDFYVKNFNLGGDPPGMLVGSVQVDVPAGATVEALCTDCWRPPSEGHFCVEARIPLYQNPNDPTIVEATELNNIAQSNYHRFYTGAASPAARVKTRVEIRNPYPQTAILHINANQTEARYRAYLQTTRLRLDPGEVRTIDALFEFTGDVPALIREQQKLPLNLLSITGEAVDPGISPQDERTTRLLGGVTAAVQAALATRIPEVDLGRRDAQIFEVFGSVQVVDAIGLPVNGGQVVMTLTFADGTEGTWSAPVQADGSFQVTANRGDGVSKLELHYTGTDRFAPTDYDQAL